MAAFTKFQDFVERLGTKQHDLNGDTFKVFLTNEAPVAASDTVKGDMAEITAQNGYPSGGTDIQNAATESGGTLTMTAVDVTFTASGGSFGPFQYAVIYNDTNATKYLLGYYDYGSAVTVLDGESFKVDFGASLLTLT